jgi:hypothetical protein
MPYRHEGDRRVRIDSWEGHVEQSIREAQERGDFDNLPGAGKPLDLEENPYAGEWQSAFRMARNAGAAPLWVQLDREIATDRSALREMAARTARHLRRERERLDRAGEGAGPPGAGAAGTPRWRAVWRRLLFGPPPAPDGGERFVPRTPADLETERRRARALYLKRAAEVDAKIKDFNTYRPPNLTWLEKPRLLPDAAGRDFDALCPPQPA